MKAPLSLCPFEKQHPSLLKKDDEYYMKLAFNQAINAWNENEVPIGAVIVCNDEVIAAAYNSVEKLKDPTAHAEILAATQAANFIGDWRLNDTTLYVTKEPCPMCSGMTIMARFKRVVYAFGDPKMGGLGGAYNINELPDLNHHTEIESGILQEDCKAILQAFFKMKREMV